MILKHLFIATSRTLKMPGCIIGLFTYFFIVGFYYPAVEFQSAGCFAFSSGESSSSTDK